MSRSLPQRPRGAPAEQYRAFPDGHSKRIFLASLAEHADLLRAIWTDPQSLDPSKRTATVTLDIAERIAALARALEAAGQDPERVATFLMRCLFTMFAEDIRLLPEKPFSHALENWWLPNPASFPGGVGSLWQAMDRDRREWRRNKCLAPAA